MRVAVVIKHNEGQSNLAIDGIAANWGFRTSDSQIYLSRDPVCLKDDETTGQATGHYICVNGRGRSPERNYDDGAGEDYRIGTLSKINNIIYCKNDCLQSTT